MRVIKNLGIAAGLLYVFTDIFGILSPLYVPTNSSQATTVWLTISPVFEVLFERVEVVGGIWVLLVTWGAVLEGRLPRALNYLGMVIGGAGVLSLFPALEVLGHVFRLGEMVWFGWLGIFVLRSSQSVAARRLRAFFVALASHVRACKSKSFRERRLERWIRNDNATRRQRSVCSVRNFENDRINNPGGS